MISEESIAELRETLTGIGQAINGLAEANGQIGTKDQAVEAASNALQQAQDDRKKTSKAFEEAVAGLKDAASKFNSAVQQL